MRDKRMTAADVVGRLKSGMTIGIGGWGPRRKPMGLVREILRSDLKDLTVVAFGGADVGMLCAAKKVKKLIFGFVTLDFIPVEPWFRKARQNGEIEVWEFGEGMFQWGLKAAAFQIPFLPTRVGLGTQLAELGHLKYVTSPYDDGEVMIAMPALKLDATLLHVTRADARGNVQLLGIDTYYDEWFARAAKEVYVSSEVVVDRIEDEYSDDLRYNIIQRNNITGVVHMPLGAHPSSFPPLYGFDKEAFTAYAKAAKDPGDWAAVADRFVGASEEAYLDSIGRDKIKNLPLPVY